MEKMLTQVTPLPQYNVDPSNVVRILARLLLGGGGRVPPDSEKFAKNREEKGQNREKRGKIGKKRQKSGGFFHFAPPDRQGWLRYCRLPTLIGAGKDMIKARTSAFYWTMAWPIFYLVVRVQDSKTASGVSTIFFIIVWVKSLIFLTFFFFFLNVLLPKCFAHIIVTSLLCFLKWTHTNNII